MMVTKGFETMQRSRQNYLVMEKCPARFFFSFFPSLFFNGGGGRLGFWTWRSTRGYCSR